ncbi:MAG: hypothetical protein LBC12_03840 [Nitrososphaerota archaeon]|nr:hypothetical protein [Nitrososphaerota archaeon]
MDIVELLANNDVKSVEKREEIAKAIQIKSVTIGEIQSLRAVLDDKNMALFFEAMEVVSSKNPEVAKFSLAHFCSRLNFVKVKQHKKGNFELLGT